ncbi:MAG: beta-L-arabinofuranosidase domain-containing protein [Sphingobacterium sp.]
MKQKKIITYLFLSILLAPALQGQTAKKLDYFDLKDVRLLESPFKNAQDVDLNYLLSMDADRLLAPFLRESNLPTRKPSYGNWENTGLDGHIGGHYISALAYMYASTGDSRIKERLDYMLTNLERCQKENNNGYVGGVPGGQQLWQEIKDGQINASGFSLNDKWVPLYNIHKTYAGLRDAYLLTGSQRAKAMLINMTDWAILLVAQLSEAQIQDMLTSEHGGLNETFADVCAITKNPKYLALARKFSQRTILDPLIQHQDSLTGLHANTQIPKVLGYKRIADLDHDEKWADAAAYFWDNVVQQRTISIGGNSVSEHFNPVQDFSKMMHSVEGPETCNTYNMLRLTKMLYQTAPQGKYLDYYERSLYNHILSTQHPEHRGFVYFTQMRPAHYRVYSQPHTSMWCCVGSGMENHAKYGEMIYASKGDSLYVNLFIPSKLNWHEKNIEITQNNNFPATASTSITIDAPTSTSFTLHIRTPSWLVAAPIVRINSKQVVPSSSTADYISIERTWKKGDRVELTLPMGIHLEQLPDKSNFYSFLYGPIVLAARYGDQDLKGLRADDSRMGHIASGKQVPMATVPLLTGDPATLPRLVEPIDSKPLHFSLTSLYRGEDSLQMELEPFYSIHDARYIIYWPQATALERIEIQKQIAESEIAALQLNANTIDKVVCGEQQPESDHFFNQQHSNSGVMGDVRWRQTKTWFSYRMNVALDENLELYIKYLNDAEPLETEITIDGQRIATLKTSKNKGITATRFPWPRNLLAREQYEIKLQAGAKKTSHKILEVRILNAGRK